ncbi:hypothetical protein NQ314_009966 [Rhamnusium bicolor]|uniref:ALMS motif domain-containing protein n=1 Tax=Rhamnusium bicolor TaxID=1586634 RepID=A0AAV8XWL2_9CUCU|nr:hypothetical protein NQ314_009966 [Rhamnusium bicolor]
MVSEESDHGSKKSKKSKRNFVIETQLGAQISSDMCYKLGDTKYTVQELNVKKTTEPSKTRQILGDINVVSGDSTTNIKVTTFCESCKRAPCICDVTKSSICQICKSTPCICPSSSRKMCSCGCVKNNSCRKCKKSLCETANTSSTESVSSRKTICLNCHRATCICSKIESGLSTISKKCSIHEESPCHCIAKEMVQSSPSDEYTGTFIPAILPKSAINGENMKFSTFPYAAKDKYGRKQNIKSSDNCSLCGKNPCVCAYLKKDFVSSAISKNVLPRQHAVEIQSGSLKRVFENCCCTTQMAQAKCHCDFVQKLINHFDISDIPSTILKDLNYYDNKNSQTEESKPKCACQHVGIQTQMEIKHQNLQTLCDIENKVSQTDDCLAGHDCKHVGVQTHTNMKHQISQGSNCNMVQNTTSQYCQPEQTLYEYQATQTELVKYTSGDDEHKKGVYFAENVMDCMKSCEKQEVVCTCGSTQIDSDLLQSCSSKPTSSSCSKCNNADTKRDVKCTCKHTLTDSIPHIKKQVEISTSVNRKEQFRGKTDSLETNTIYEMSSKSTSLIVSSYETDISESPCEDSTSKSPTLIICVCCKEKHAPENICMQGSVNKNYPLCKYCVQRRPILTAHCYAGPEHVCTCYKPVRANILHEIKKTVNDLHNLEHCMCINPGLRKNMPIQYCTYCQFRLGQNFRSKKGIAYTLTLENESPRKLKSKRKRKKPALEEIRIKVPYSYNKKKCKDKENFSRKDSAKEKMRRCTESVTVNNSCPKDSKIKMNKTQKCRSLTLQEYLKKNKPEFIDSAEYRRQSLIISRSERELSKEEVKLRFFEDNIHNKQKLFTEKEMKEITKRNYRKLPEIRERVNNMKEQKLRSADKFIADIFTRDALEQKKKDQKTILEASACKRKLIAEKKILEEKKRKIEQKSMLETKMLEKDIEDITKKIYNN